MNRDYTQELQLLNVGSGFDLRDVSEAQSDGIESHNRESVCCEEPVEF